jgi:hypothetical protein
MTEKWVMTNFITGKNETIPEKVTEEGPTIWWVEGWECYMQNGQSDNPYEQGTTEYWEWMDGHEAARAD